jgi:hypothetical protein
MIKKEKISQLHSAMFGRMGLSLRGMGRGKPQGCIKDELKTVLNGRLNKKLEATGKLQGQDSTGLV